MDDRERERRDEGGIEAKNPRLDETVQWILITQNNTAEKKSRSLFHIPTEP